MYLGPISKARFAVRPEHGRCRPGDSSLCSPCGCTTRNVSGEGATRNVSPIVVCPWPIHHTTCHHQDKDRPLEKSTGTYGTSAVQIALALQHDQPCRQSVCDRAFSSQFTSFASTAPPPPHHETKRPDGGVQQHHDPVTQEHGL
jgi:hypothetical protein